MVDNAQHRETVNATCLSSIQVGFVASLVSKLSDTVSSEIGKVGTLTPPPLRGAPRLLAKIAPWSPKLE